MNIYDAARILGLTGAITPEKSKAAYHQACKKYHPDVNPAGDDMMRLVNAAYDALKEYEGEVTEETSDYGNALNEALNAVFGLSGLVVEICGAWVWITGNTREHKDHLKQVGFKWANKKNAWYFRPEEYRSRSKGSSTLEEIRAKYGSSRPQYSRKDYMIASVLAY